MRLVMPSQKVKCVNVIRREMGRVWSVGRKQWLGRALRRRYLTIGLHDRKNQLCQYQVEEQSRRNKNV